MQERPGHGPDVLAAVLELPRHGRRLGFFFIVLFAVAFC